MFSWVRRDTSDALVEVNIAKVDWAWSKSWDYISPVGHGRDAQRYARAFEFIKAGAPASPDNLAGEKTLIAPEVTLAPGTEALFFLDGRHRFAALRDHGYENAFVAVSPSIAPRIRSLFGALGVY